TLVALNKVTGEVIWKAAVDKDERADYSPAAVAEVGGVRQYVQSLQQGLVGISANDGHVLWRHTKTANRIIHTSALVIRKNLVFCAGAYGTEPMLLRIVCEDERFRVEEVYSSKQIPLFGWHSGPVLVGDYFYAVAGKTAACIEF